MLLNEQVSQRTIIGKQPHKQTYLTSFLQRMISFKVKLS